MAVPTGGPGLLKFTTIMLYVVVLSGLVLGVVKAGVHWQKTGDHRPMVESTLGQILYWDSQIYEGIEYLKDDNFMAKLPESFRDDFRNFVVKQVVFYMILFLILGYLLYKFGNWIMGRASFDPTTDIIILAVIIFIIFPASEMAYGWLMHDELVVPYRGVAQLVKPTTWEALIGNTEVVAGGSVYDNYINSINDSGSNYNNTIDGGG